MSNNIWRKSLVDLRPLFGDSARKFSDSRLVVVAAYPTDRANLDEMVKEHIGREVGGLSKVRSWLCQSHEYPSRSDQCNRAVTEEFQDGFSFYGDPNGVDRFEQLADSAGSCLGPHVGNLIPVDGWTSHNPMSSVPDWCKAIFHVARQSLDGIGLRDRRTVNDAWPSPSFCSVLVGNPFQASMILIDVLTETVGDTTKPYMSAIWFMNEFGISAERLRSARRSKKIATKETSKHAKQRYLYSVYDAMKLWPEDVTYLPNDGVRPKKSG